MAGSVEAYIKIESDPKAADIEFLTKKFVKMAYVKAAREIAGNSDLMLLVGADSVQELNSYVDCIRKIKGVHRIETYLVLNKLK